MHIQLLACYNKRNAVTHNYYYLTISSIYIWMLIIYANTRVCVNKNRNVIKYVEISEKYSLYLKQLRTFNNFFAIV